ncbi:sensor histidine kinase [Pontibacter roseus]|uniref:sensor histidine kinase n=1 Tax=Pontibacter roseus TaxID=336989 RepID=UPI0003660247|nr:sensor histidine kinase [Pontibacter roseus]
MESPESLNPWLPVLISTPLMLLLVAGIVLFVMRYHKRLVAHHEHLRHLEAVRQRQLLEAALEAQEAERRRVARDLHDEVGGMLALIRLNIGQVARQSAEAQTATETALRAKQQLDEAIGSVRRISHDLMPVVLEKMGLVQAIKGMAHSFPPDGGLEMRFTHNLDQQRLDARQELLLFRILQELLNNSLKHAGASLITVDLHKTATEASLTYTDNGRGFDYQPVQQGGEQAGGLGLRNLESRVALLNGRFHYNSRRGAGIKAEIVIPIT